MHWHPPGGWSTQVAYLNALKRPIWLPPPFGFDPLLVTFLRHAIMEGTDATKTLLKTFLDSMGLLSAFIMVVSFELSWIDYYDQQDCTAIFEKDVAAGVWLCNAQVWFGVTATMLCIILTTYCIAWGLSTAIWSQESICYQFRRSILMTLYVPLFLMFFIGACLSFCLMIKIVFQTAGYDEAFLPELEKGRWPGVFSVAAYSSMAWCGIMIFTLTAFYFVALLELRARDLDLGNHWSMFLCCNSDVGFSNEFLVQVGVLVDHPSEPHEETEQPQHRTGNLAAQDKGRDPVEEPTHAGKNGTAIQSSMYPPVMPIEPPTRAVWTNVHASLVSPVVGTVRAN